MMGAPIPRLQPLKGAACASVCGASFVGPPIRSVRCRFCQPHDATVHYCAGNILRVNCPSGSKIGMSPTEMTPTKLCNMNMGVRCLDKRPYGPPFSVLLLNLRFSHPTYQEVYNICSFDMHSQQQANAVHVVRTSSNAPSLVP